MLVVVGEIFSMRLPKGSYLNVFERDKLLRRLLRTACLSICNDLGLAAIIDLHSVGSPPQKRSKMVTSLLYCTQVTQLNYYLIYARTRLTYRSDD